MSINSEVRADKEAVDNYLRKYISYRASELVTSEMILNYFRAAVYMITGKEPNQEMEERQLKEEIVYPYIDIDEKYVEKIQGQLDKKAMQPVVFLGS